MTEHREQHPALVCPSSLPPAPPLRDRERIDPDFDLIPLSLLFSSSSISSWGLTEMCMMFGWSGLNFASITRQLSDQTAGFAVSAFGGESMLHTSQNNLIIQQPSKEDKPYTPRNRRLRFPILSPIPPYQLLQRINTDIKRVGLLAFFFVLHLEDVAFSQVGRVNLVGVALSVLEHECY